MNAENKAEKNTSRPAGRARRERHVVLVGPIEELAAICARLKDTPSASLDGIFSGSDSWRLPGGLTLLGTPSAVLSYLEGGAVVDDVYFSMGSLGREETLSFETQDVEIQDFVNRVKRRKKLKKLAGTAALALGSLLGLLLLAWIFGLV